MVGGANIRKEPAVPSLTHPDAVFLGMDVHKDSISVGILNPGHERQMSRRSSTTKSRSDG
jgi:hypothetical protein